MSTRGLRATVARHSPLLFAALSPRSGGLPSSNDKRYFLAAPIRPQRAATGVWPTRQNMNK